jgi:hypothetical protein
MTMIIYDKKHKTYIVRVPGSGRRDERAKTREDAVYLEMWHEYSRLLTKVPGFREADQKLFDRFGGK